MYFCVCGSGHEVGGAAYTCRGIEVTGSAFPGNTAGEMLAPSGGLPAKQWSGEVQEEPRFR